ncbi:MAG: hypothetical protein RLY58_951 [Pseudomonadota bacterium]|jgi:hypothetical protein
MTEFKPYADDALSLQVAGLTLENQQDRIALYGQIDLTRDQQGLAHAQQLKAWLDAIVTTLCAETLPERIQNERIEAVDNPFTAD